MKTNMTPSERAEIFLTEQEMMTHRDKYCPSVRKRLARRIKEGTAINDIPNNCKSCHVLAVSARMCIHYPTKIK